MKPHMKNREVTATNAPRRERPVGEGVMGRCLAHQVNESAEFLGICVET